MTTKPSRHLEFRALAALETIQAGRALSTVDRFSAFFPNWPGPARKAARILAAHANAARGQDVLWLVGVGQGQRPAAKPPGADLSRFDAWQHEVCACFDGLAPGVRALPIPTAANGKHPAGQVVALQIETNRAPFVVQAIGGAAGALEVPWWDADEAILRPAGRQELVRLLVPLQDLPECEVLEAELTFYMNPHATGTQKSILRWTLDGSLYVIPPNEGRTVVPLHRCRADIRVPGSDFVASAQDINLTADKASPGVRITESAALIDGLGRIFVYCSGSTAAVDIPWQAPLTVTFDLPPTGTDRTAVAMATLHPEPTKETIQAGRWKL